MELTQGVLQWEYLVKPISIYIIVWVFRLGGCAKGAGGVYKGLSLAVMVDSEKTWPCVYKY